MRTIEELEKLYTTTLEGRLTGLEDMRKKIVKTINIILGVVIGTIVLMGILGLLGFGIIVVIFLGIVLGIALTHGKMKRYRAAFKSQVVAEVIHLIDDSWTYDSERHIPLNDYHTSKLFTHGVDRHSGDDYVKGRIDKTDFEFSELHTEYKKVTTDSKGRTQTSWHTIFKGLFFHADFNKHLKGETLVLPDTAQRLFGKFGQSLQKMSGRGELVKMEDVEFEKQYVVYGSEQIEPRYILTPVMMEKMVQLRKQYGHELHFSFVGTRVYCAVSITKNMFEPRIFKSGANFEDIKEIHHYIALIEVLVHEMNLNTRIWTKE